MELVKLEIKDIKKIKSIYKEAFPLKERKPFWSLKESMKNHRMELICGVENNQIFGFGTCYPYQEYVYLDYLAMRSDLRGHGYGAQYLNKIFEYYQDKTIILIMERLDEPSDNAEQRVKRKAFYLKNGFRETNLFTSAVSGNYEILVHGKDITGDKFIEIMNYSLGKLFEKLAKYHIVD